MTARHRTIAALAGAVAAVLGGIGLLGGGSAPEAPARDVAGLPAAAPVPSSRSLPSYAVVEAHRAETPLPAPSTAPVADAAVRAARDLFARLEKAAGLDPTLPADLQRDLLAFLAESEANRTALFRMVWEPGASRMVLGHLKLFLIGLPDEAQRLSMVAALESFDPQHAERVEMAAKAKDPALLASELRRAASSEEKTRRIRLLSKEVCAEPAVAAFLLETAREDRDPETRSASYLRLSVAGVAEAMPVLVAAVADDARDVKERSIAAMSLGISPARPPADDLVRLFEASPPDVRRNLLASLARAGSSRRVDDLLLDALVAEGSGIETRKSASNAIGIRIFLLPAGEARDLGARTATAMKELTPDLAAAALPALGPFVVKNEPLREAVQDMHRTAPAGGAIQLAIASSPALRMVAGL